MRKELLALAATFILCSTIASPSAFAAVYLNDTFTRSQPYPWIVGCSTGGGIGGCPSAEADVAIVSNQLRITVSVANNTGFALYPTSLDVENFTYEFDYTHNTGNFFVADWDDRGSPSTKYMSVRFDTGAGVIHISDSPFLMDYLTDTYPFDTLDIVSVPYDFSGWTDSSTHHIKLWKSGQTLTISIGGAQVYTLTDSRLDVHFAQVGLGNYRVGLWGLNYAAFDNAVVQGIPAKIIPNIYIVFSPSDVVTVGQLTRATCGSDTLGLTLHLRMGSTDVTNPYEFTPTLPGNVGFECCSDETDTYMATCNGNVLEVTAGPTTTTVPGGPLIPLEPVSAIDAAAWTAAGYGWILPFFSAFFMATMFLIGVSAIAGYVGGPYAAVASAIILTFAYSLMGIYSPFVAVIMVLLAIGSAAYLLARVAGGPGVSK
jgi:hypothetical protein